MMQKHVRSGLALAAAALLLAAPAAQAEDF
jgi:hypothetical protein